MPGHFKYSTHPRDAIVNSVRILVGALPANIEAPIYINTDEWSDSYLTHGILSTYLYDVDLRRQVILRMLDTGDLLESNCNKAVIEVVKKDKLKVDFSSLDPDDKNVSDLEYIWNFGSGEGESVSTKEKAITHIFKKSGTYEVTLLVKNLDGDTEASKVNVVVNSGCINNCDYPKIKATVTGAIQTTDYRFEYLGPTTKGNSVTIKFEDENNPDGLTEWEVQYRNYVFDSSPIFKTINIISNLDTNVINIPFASTYFLGVGANNKATGKRVYHYFEIAVTEDVMPQVSTRVECYTGAHNVIVSAKDPDSGVIAIGIWLPNQTTGIYEGTFLDGSNYSPFGYLYSFNYYEFNHREYIYSTDMFGRKDVRIIYKNSNGKVGYIPVKNTCLK